MPKAPNESSFHETKCWNTFKRQFYAIWCCEMRDTSTKQFGDLWNVKLGFWQNRANAEAWFWLSKAIIKDTKCIKASELWNEKWKMSNILGLLSCENVKYIGAVIISNTLKLRSCENLAAKGVLSRYRGNWESQNYIGLWTQIWSELYIQMFWKVARYCRSFWATIIFQQQTVAMHGVKV